MKNELKQREAVWSRVHWEVVGPIKIQTLQGRMVRILAFLYKGLINDENICPDNISSCGKGLCPSFNIILLLYVGLYGC
jgi:hypothetical protein